MNLLKSSIIAIISGYILMLLSVLISSFGDSLMLPALYIYATLGGVFLVFGYIVWGLPVHFLLNKFKKTGWHWYLFFGLLPAFIFVLIALPYGNDEWFYLVSQSFSLGVFSSCCSLVLWFFHVRKNV